MAAHKRLTWFHGLAGPADTPLTSWLRTVLAATLLIPVAVFVIVASWGYDQTRAEAEAAVGRAADLALDHAQKTFAIALEVARHTGEISTGPDQQVLADQAALQQRLIDTVVGLPSTLNVNVWDANGRALLRSDAPIDREVSIADRAYFIEQRDQNPGIGVTDVFLGRQTGKELMNLTIRRPSDDGSFRGIVAVSLSPAYFRGYYQSLTRDDPRLASFSLIRTDGVFLARSPPPPDGSNRVPPDSPTLRRIRAGETAGSHQVPARNGREARIVSFRRVPDYPLYVVVGFSRRAVFADWTRFVGILAAIMVPTTAGLFYVTWVALRKTRREQQIAKELDEETRRRAAAERSMLESQRLNTLSALTSGVAHDFNNLLAIISTSLHVLRLKNPALGDDRQVQAMTRAIQSGTRLTRQLLSFSRKQALKPEPVHLRTWLPPVAELIRSSLGANVTLRVSVAPDTAPIRVAPAELELALINLALNARHALPHGGSIELNAHNARPSAGDGMRRVTISVTDDGVGIPADVLPRVREAFYTTREAGTGSGLGLTQVDALVMQSGGSMQIDSAVGSGTTVRLDFPAIDAAEPAASAPGGPVTARLRGVLLLVEDNDEVSASMKSLLSGWGITVHATASAAAALDWLARAERLPDVVLSDIAMPGRMNGVDLALKLQDDHPGLPVLLTTGYTDQLEHAVRAGVEVLPKPIAPAELLERLRRILEAPVSDTSGVASGNR